jgi:hypothetical protein
MFGFALCLGVVLGGITSDYKRFGPNADLHHLHFPGCPAASDCSEQVHLQLGGPHEMVVVYVSFSAKIKSVVQYGLDKTKLDQTAIGDQASYSQLMTFTRLQTGNGRLGAPTSTNEEIQKYQDTTAWARSPDFSSSYHQVNLSADPFFDPVANASMRSFSGLYLNPQVYYSSPMIHTVTLSDLLEGTTYYYSVDGLPDVFQFTFVPATKPNTFLPIRFGLVSDMGQTNVSAKNVEVMAGWDIDAILHAGDLSYADGFDPLWDSYGRMMQPLASRVPIMSTDGNHEVGAGIETRVSYNARYPMPFKQSGSSSNAFWSRDIGPVHVIGLSSYTSTDSTSFQFQWLAQDLQGVDRTRTPWLVVMMHVPWYNSNSNHKNEAFLMMLDMEDLLFKAGVDFVLDGHVHSYERTLPVYQNVTNACGPVYMTMGDGGNREGVAKPWIDPQPTWSAFREASFGVGRLDVLNETHAQLGWYRNACQNDSLPGMIDFSVGCATTGDNGNAHAISDTTWLIRDPTCSNKRSPRR